MARKKTIGDLPIALGLVLLAWAHRLFFLFSNSDYSWPFTIFYEGDSEAFYDYARAILDGIVYDGGIPFHPPAFPYFLSGVHTLVGAGPGADRVPYVPLKVVMALLGSVSVGLGYLLARPYLGRAVAVTGGMLAVYSFGLYVVAIAPVSESLYSALLLTALLVWTRKLQHPLSSLPSNLSGRFAGLASTTVWGVTLGATLGLLCLTRAEGALTATLLLAAGAGPAVFPRRGSEEPPRKSGGKSTSRWSGLRPWLAAAVALILVMLPWTIRNAVRLDAVNKGLAGQIAHPLPEFVPITAYGPLNFSLANNALADGTFSREILTSQSQSATLDLRDPQHLEHFLHGYGIGWKYLRAHPGAFARLALQKWGLLFGSLRLGWTQWDFPGGLDGVRRPVDLFVPNSVAGLWIHLVLLLAGLSLLVARSRGHRGAAVRTPDRRDAKRLDGDTRWTSGADGVRRWLGISVMVTIAAMIATGLFFGYARLGVILFPIWLMTSAVTLVAIGSWVNRRMPGLGRPRPARLMLLGVIAGLFLLEAWGATGGRNYNATGTQAEGASHLNPHDTMFLEVIEKR